jgi:segregation and condensation protein B
MDQTSDKDDEQAQKQLIEALLFTSPDPLKLRDFKKVVDLHGKRIKSIIQQLNDEYNTADRAFEIREIAEGYQMLTRPDFEDELQDFYGREQDHSLSQAAMETLSIVAYEQPITRSELESVRGVQSGQLLRNLMDQGFLTMKGRKDAPGRPILYGTSEQFLEVFGLSSIDELPEPEELVD